MVKGAVVVGLLLLSTVQGLYFGVTAKPFCFDIEADLGKTIKFYYEVTGDKPENMQVHIVNEGQNNAQSLTGANGNKELSADSATAEKPKPTAPTRFSRGTRQLRKLSVPNWVARVPNMPWMGRISRPGRSRSTNRAVGLPLHWVITRNRSASPA